MKKLNITWEGIHDPTGYLFSFAKSLACAVKNSPWSEKFEDVVATSGFAFRMWVSADLCPSATSIWDFSSQKPWVENSGLSCDYVGRYWGEDTVEEERRLYAVDMIKRSLEAGIPAVSWDIGVPEWGIIKGFDDAREVFFTLAVNGEGELEYSKLGKRELPILSVLTLINDTKKSADEIMLDTKRLAAGHLKGLEWCENAKGLAAYPALIKHFEKENFNPEAAWNREYFLGTYAGLKYYAWKYFDKYGDQKLAGLYQKIYSAWSDAFKMNASGAGTDGNMTNAPECIISRLREAEQNETEAAEIMYR